MSQISLFQTEQEVKQEIEVADATEKLALLNELQYDVYGCDLRNWKDEGITREAILRRCAEIVEGNDTYPNCSGSRYFDYVFKNLLLKYGVSAEQIANRILDVRDKNIKQMCDTWARDVTWCYKIHLEYKTKVARGEKFEVESEAKYHNIATWLEHAKQDYDYYTACCKALRIEPKSFDSLTIEKVVVKRVMTEVVSVEQVKDATQGRLM